MVALDMSCPHHNVDQDQNARLVHLPVEGRLPAQHWGEREEEGLKGVRNGQEGEELNS